jgi:hypothetical protein
MEPASTTDAGPDIQRRNDPLNLILFSPLHTIRLLFLLQPDRATEHGGITQAGRQTVSCRSFYFFR